MVLELKIPILNNKNMLHFLIQNYILLTLTSHKYMLYIFIN